MDRPTQRQRFVKTDRVAEALDVDVKTVGLWIAQGRIRGVIKTPGGQWRIPVDEYERILRGDPLPAEAKAS